MRGKLSIMGFSSAALVIRHEPFTGRAFSACRVDGSYGL
jgi:hypothetical protein